MVTKSKTPNKPSVPPSAGRLVTRPSASVKASSELTTLLRQTRRSANLDQIKWWTDGVEPLPPLDHIVKKGRVVTMQDATPARLRTFQAATLGNRLIALEFSIDFTAKHLQPGPQRESLDQRVFRALVARLCPWTGLHLKETAIQSPELKKHRPLARVEVKPTPDGKGWKLGGVGKRVSAGRKKLEKLGMRAGSVYFGENIEKATSMPRSRPAVQVKVYFKVEDHGLPLPVHRQRVRVEVTCNARAIDELFGGRQTVRDVVSLNFRQLVNQYLRFALPVAMSSVAPTATTPAHRTLLAVAHKSRSTSNSRDAARAVDEGNFTAMGHSGIDFERLLKPTDVLRETADNLVQKRKPVELDWDLRR